MPRFYIHSYDSIEARDEEGFEFANLDAARQQAVRSARELIASEILTEGQLHLSHYLEIEDESGTITSITFADCVEVYP